MGGTPPPAWERMGCPDDGSPRREGAGRPGSPVGRVWASCFALVGWTDAFPWGAGHGTLRWTHASEQAGKALRSQGHQCVVM